MLSERTKRKIAIRLVWFTACLVMLWPAMLVLDWWFTVFWLSLLAFAAALTWAAWFLIEDRDKR